MSVISQIGRRSRGVRALFIALYALLILGALTMIYPFAIMLAGSTQSAVDLREQRVVPRFLLDDEALYRKHAEALFNESVDLLNTTYNLDTPSFDRLAPPAAIREKLVAEWRDFLDAAPLPDYAFGCGYLYTPVSRTTPLSLRAFRAELAAQYGSSIETVNRVLGADFAGWNSFFVLPANFLLRQTRPADSEFMRQFDLFKRSRPRWLVYGFSVEGFYKKLFLKTQYTRDIAEYNRLHGTAYASYDRIHLSEALPAGTAAEQADWEQFVRHTLNLLWIRLLPSARSNYQDYVEARYRRIDEFNGKYGTSYAAFGDIPLPNEPPAGGLPLSDWDAFIGGWRDPDTGTLHLAPAATLRIHSLDLLFQKYLRARYTDVERLNAALGTRFRGFSDILPPQQEAHYLGFLDQRRLIKRHFLLRNFQTVLDYLLFHGRGLVNTVVYCFLAVLFGLLINPLAAYALSRYRLPGTYKILLFLMLTMAFPPMVTQIPVFLMLRDLRLLNTFAALLLPGLANGYSIFLLKGFFDSLPRDLYESAQLDGAGEWTMFWNITMRLSMPILAVLALASFTAAYTNFMFALLICQDESMWTLMVWLYELQQRSGQPVLYASLIIAALPTFLLFFLCQRIIIRGLVVPMEK